MSIEQVRGYLENSLKNKRSLLVVGSLSSVQVVTVFVGFFTSIIWARYVEKDVYGQYQVIISIMTIVNSLCLPGLSESLMISAAKGYDGNLTRIIKYKTLSLLAGSMAIVCIGFYYYFSSDPKLAYGLFAAVLIFPLFQLDSVWTAWLNGRGFLKRVSLFRVITIISTAVMLLILVWLGMQDLEILVIGLIGLPGLLSVIVIAGILSQRKNKAYDNASIRYGFHTTAASLLSGLIATDRLFLNNYVSAEAVAVYSIANIFPDQLKSVYAVFNPVLVPKTYSADSVFEAWQNIKRQVYILFFLFIVLGIAGFILLPVIVPMLFSERYVSSVQYAKWLWLTVSFSTPTTFLANVLRAQKKVKFVYIFSLIQPIMGIILYAALIGYGTSGIVLSKVIYYLATGVIFTGSFFYFLNHEKRETVSL